VTAPDAPSRPAERLAVALLDHHLGALGYAAVPQPRPAGGGWRRLYLGAGPAGGSAISVVGPAEGGWCSLGVEFPTRSAVARDRASELVRALAPYEVALDLDASDGGAYADPVVRVALRVFLDGLGALALRDVVENLAEAAGVARHVLA
jgi:hypothetical protein